VCRHGAQPSYGYGYRNVKKLQKNKNDDGTPTLLYNTYSGSVGGATSDSGKDICGVQQANGGQWLYQELITGKVRILGTTWTKARSRTRAQFLDSSGRKGVNGWTRYYDACTETPFLYSPRKQVLIAYDECAVSLVAPQTRP
jgi:chitinase